MRFNYADVLGVRTRYLSGGSGPGVLLVHGVGMSADSWFHAVPALEQQFSVAAPDLLDNGFTGAGPDQDGAPHPMIVTHLVALADHLGFKRFSIVGSSLGAAMALLTYFRIPDRIERIVLVGPGSTISPPSDSGDALRASYLNGRSAIENPTYESCRARLGRVFYDAARVPDVLVAMQMMMYAQDGALDAFERRMARLRSPESKKHEVHSRLDQVKVPTLVLTGREDIRGNLEETKRATARLPQAKLLIYDRCGHWPHMEHPDDFNRDVTAFLSSASQPARKPEAAAQLAIQEDRTGAQR